LGLIVEAWPGLSPAARAALIAVVRASTEGAHVHSV
jgi:hypothetical protein